MLEPLQKTNQGKAAKTRATDASIIRKLKETWPYDLDMGLGMSARPLSMNG